jgi:hypothetical protein
MEFKALALGKQVKAEALNSNVHLLSITLIIFLNLYRLSEKGVQTLVWQS